jgi:hypothetical protein
MATAALLSRCQSGPVSSSPGSGDDVWGVRVVWNTAATDAFLVLHSTSASQTSSTLATATNQLRELYVSE